MIISIDRKEHYGIITLYKANKIVHIGVSSKGEYGIYPLLSSKMDFDAFEFEEFDSLETTYEEARKRILAIRPLFTRLQDSPCTRDTFMSFATIQDCLIKREFIVYRDDIEIDVLKEYAKSINLETVEYKGIEYIYKKDLDSLFDYLKTKYDFPFVSKKTKMKILENYKFYSENNEDYIKH